MARDKMPNFLFIQNNPSKMIFNSMGGELGQFYPACSRPFHTVDQGPTQIYVHEAFFEEKKKEAVADAWRDAALFYTKEGGAVNLDLLAVANEKRMS